MSQPTAKQPKILLFDIESTSLKADFGSILCIGYKYLGQSTVYCPSIMDYSGWAKDPFDDRRLLRDFSKVWNEADMVVGYFSKGFDVKFINARLGAWGMDFLAPAPHVDLFYTVKANLALSRKSLQNVGYHLHLSNEKTPVEGRIWMKAQQGRVSALHYVIRHCKSDVLILEEAYEILRPLVRTHPRVRGYHNCRFCGSNHLQRRGYQLSATKSRKQRYQCQDCAGWSTYLGV